MTFGRRSAGVMTRRGSAKAGPPAWPCRLPFPSGFGVRVRIHVCHEWQRQGPLRRPIHPQVFAKPGRKAADRQRGEYAPRARHPHTGAVVVRLHRAARLSPGQRCFQAVDEARRGGRSRHRLYREPGPLGARRLVVPCRFLCPRWRTGRDVGCGWGLVPPSGLVGPHRRLFGLGAAGRANPRRSRRWPGAFVA